MRTSFRITALAVLAFAAACAPKAYRQEADLVWPVLPENPRIKYLETFRGSNYYAPSVGRNLMEYFAGEDPSLVIMKPIGVTADDKGNVYVADVPPRIIMLDREHETVRLVADSGQARPLGVGGLAFFNPRNELIICDTARKAVLVVDPETNALKRQFAEGFTKPVGVAVDEPRDRIAVADSARHTVTVMNLLTGKVEFTMGGIGTEEGKMFYPLAVAFDKDGKIYVSDSMNFRVQIFDERGAFVSSIGSLGINLGQFSRPKGLALDSEGHLYVVDAAFQNVQVFDPQTGNLLLFFGDGGSGPGGFQLPYGLYIDKHDRIYVADQFNYRIQVFQYLNRDESKRLGELGRQGLTPPSVKDSESKGD